MASETAEIEKVEGESDRGSPSTEQLRRELEEQFNVQRARMKELFLQKEENLQRLILDKQQLESEVLGLRAELQQLQILSDNQKSELQNLQLLVSETVEASSSGSEEARRLRAQNIELQQHLAQLKHQLQIAQQVYAVFFFSIFL
ncbi:hypothetical protein O0L34_g14487 [Tuta absoluta]|nr:hypothetical protein O0L34_g14487 [Tuta absoluta]